MSFAGEGPTKGERYVKDVQRFPYADYSDFESAKEYGFVHWVEARNQIVTVLPPSRHLGLLAFRPCENLSVPFVSDAFPQRGDLWNPSASDVHDIYRYPQNSVGERAKVESKCIIMRVGESGAMPGRG